MPMMGTKISAKTKQKTASVDNEPTPVTRQIILSCYFLHSPFAFVP